MSVFNYFDLLGGLAIFLFGMLMMNSSLTAIAGDRLRKIMLLLTKNKFRGYLTGLGVTLVNQSSSATTVLEAVLVGAGLMTFRQSLAVTLGSALGSTFLGQLFAFPKITNFATLIIALGFFAYLLSATKKRKAVANTFLGFGILFLGMQLMSHSLEPLRRYGPFLLLMGRIEEPILGILLGLGFTMIVQSSGATTGLTIAMAIAGTITLAQAVPINLGASIGTCITAVIGSLTLNREAKRSAYIHVVFQTIGVIIAFILLLIPFRGERLWIVIAKEVTSFLTGTGTNLPRQIAMAHTLMPVVSHLLIFPLLPVIVRLFDKLVPPRKTEESFGPLYLSDTMLSEPQVALYQVKKEILRIRPIIEDMLEKSFAVFETRDIDSARKIKEGDNQVDILRKEIVLYLTKLARQTLTARQSRLQVMYLYICNELENLADVIDNNILDRARKLIKNRLFLSREGIEEIKELKNVIAENFLKIMTAFETEDLSGARELVKFQEEVWDYHAQLRQKHFNRLNQGLQASIDTTTIHMDLLNHFHRINRHIIHIALTLADNSETQEGMTDYDGYY